MKVTVEIPNTIRLEGENSIDLIVGNGMDRVTVTGAGQIVVHGNGGGAPSFTVDIKAVLEALSRTVARLEIPR